MSTSRNIFRCNSIGTLHLRFLRMIVATEGTSLDRNRIVPDNFEIYLCPSHGVQPSYSHPKTLTVAFWFILLT